MNSIHQLIPRIVRKRREIPPARALLVAISGIDASGKGHVATQLTAALRRLGQRTVVINVDGWLNLPAVRFSDREPGRHFYEHALRLDEMFARLVVPLRDNRRIRVTVDHAEEKATMYRRQVYDFPEVDIVLLEGIFLLKPAFRQFYDLSVWIDCTFETALERGIARGQEGLPPDETASAFETIYFPAQRIHLEHDRPREAASFILRNDSCLESDSPTPVPIAGPIPQLSTLIHS